MGHPHFQNPLEDRHAGRLLVDSAGIAGGKAEGIGYAFDRQGRVGVAAFDLGIDTGDIKNCYFQAERPIALLKGNKSLAEFGVRNGTIIYFTR